MKTIFVLFGALWCAGFAKADQPDLDRALDAVCRVHAPDGGLGTGCVFAIDGGQVYAITNAHVAGTRSGAAVSVEFWRDGHASRELPATVDFATPRADVGYDLAIVAIPAAAFENYLPRIIPLAQRGASLAPGDPVASVGCAKGAWPSLFRGHVVKLAGGCVDFVPPVANGRSGSALFAGDGSRIVGLVGWRDDENGVGIAMDLEAIYRAIEGQASVGTARGSLTKAADLDLGGRLVSLPQPIQPGQNCPDGDCWRPFFRPRAPTQPRQTPAPGPQSPAPNTGGAWPHRTQPAPRPNQNQNPDSAIDHSKFALKSELESLADSLQVHAGQVDAATAQTQSLAGRLELLGKTTQQNHAELAQAVGGELDQLKRDLPELVKSPAGEEAKKVAANVASELITRAAGPQAMPLLKAAALFGGPPAVVCAIAGWLVLRLLKKRLPAVQSLDNRLSSFGGAGGAAAAPFRATSDSASGGDPAGRRPYPAVGTDGNG